MGIRIKDDLFSVNLASVGRSLWIRSCGARKCSRRATARLEIDTLIANILVICFVMLLCRDPTRKRILQAQQSAVLRGKRHD